MPKIILNKSGKKFFIKDTSQDYHTQFGLIKKDDLKKNDAVTTNTGKEFSLFDPFFIDYYSKIKRDAQIIPLKDIGIIVGETGVGKDSVVVDAGAGSGALSCFLAHIAKKVTTYEIRKDFIAIVEKNIEFLGLKNIEIKNKDIYEGIDEKNVDLVTLDLPEPWKALDPAASALKAGGFLVSYSPTIPQVMDFVSQMQKREDFSYLKTIEIIEREWDVSERKVRPKSQAIGHSGFLTFARRI